jgi:hypothetical protein
LRRSFTRESLWRGKRQRAVDLPQGLHVIEAAKCNMEDMRHAWIEF